MCASYSGPVRLEFLALVGHPHKYLAEPRWNQLGGAAEPRTPTLSSVSQMNTIWTEVDQRPVTELVFDMVQVCRAPE